MTIIEYVGIDSNIYGVVNTEAFHFLLKNNPNLRLVSVSKDTNTRKEIFADVTLPLMKAPEENIGLIDTDNNDQFMWVLGVDYAIVKNPSPTIIEALTIMDNFFTHTQGERLLLDKRTHLGITLDDPRTLEAEFDFTTGQYDL